MIKVLLDTNIILDALTSRKPFHQHAERILLLAAEEKIQGFVTANSVTDIYYLVRKVVSSDKAREAIRDLLQTVSVVAIDGDDCEVALASAVDDLEDALVDVCAAKVQADYIVSRDIACAKSGGRVSVAAPDSFLAVFDSSSTASRGTESA